MSKLIVYRDSLGKEFTVYKETNLMSGALDEIKLIRNEKGVQQFDVNHFVMESWGDIFVYVCSHLDFEARKYLVIPMTFFGDAKDPSYLLDTMQRECKITFWPDGLGSSFETTVADAIPLDKLVSQVFDAHHFSSFPGHRLRFRGVKGQRNSYMTGRSRMKAKFYTSFLNPTFTQTYSLSSIKFSTFEFDLQAFLMKNKMCARIIEALNMHTPLGRYIKNIEESLIGYQKQWQTVRLSFLKNWEKVLGNSADFNLADLNNVQNPDDHKLFMQVLNKAAGGPETSFDLSPCLSLAPIPVIMDKAERDRIIRLRMNEHRRRKGNVSNYPNPYERHLMFVWMNYLVIPPNCFTYLTNLLHISGMYDITISNMLKYLLRSA